MYSVLDIQDYFGYILNKHGEKTDNSSIRIHVNKIENIITSKIKTGYYLELLTSETMELLESTKCKISKDKNGENVPHLEITEVVLVHSNIVNNDYKKDSRVQLLFPKNFIFLKIFNLEFSYIEVRFTDQNSKLLEIENKINIIYLLIKV